MSHLQWDPACSLLSVSWTPCPPPSSSAHPHSTINSCLQLYHRSNYHWYLKQQFCSAQRFLGFDAEINNRLYLFEEQGLRTIDLHWTTFSLPAADHSIAVVDGSALKVTPLNMAVVPPPMSLHTVPLDMVPAHMAFVSLEHMQEDWKWLGLLVDEEGLVSCMAGYGRAMPKVLVKDNLFDLIKDFDCYPICETPVRFRAIVGSAKDDLQVVMLGSTVNSNVLAIARMSLPALLQGTLQLDCAVVIEGIPGNVQSLQCIGHQLVFGLCGSEYEIISIDTDGLFDDGPACLYEDLLAQGRVTAIMTIPESCPSFQFIPGEHPLVIGLSSKGHLYMNDSCVHPTVGSYIYNPIYKVCLFVNLTTSSLHTLYLPQLLDLLSSPLVNPEDVQQISENQEIRPIERGGKLIANLAYQQKVVIQLPRGNLEVFELRLLVYLQLYRHLLDEHDLHKAFLLLRRQKIDPNILLSLSLSHTLEQIPEFIKALVEHKQMDYLCQFVSSLRLEEGPGLRYVKVLNDVYPHLDHTSLPAKERVYMVASRIRQHLLTVLVQSAGSMAEVVQAVLCTHAKQSMVSEAFDFIKTVCHHQYYSKEVDYGIVAHIKSIESKLGTADPVSKQAADGHAQEDLLLASIHAHILAHPEITPISLTAAVKYLSFLIDAQELFRVAFSMCDFKLAKQLVFNNQMDPKVYVPLINEHELLGASGQGTRVLHMFYRVNQHLGSHGHQNMLKYFVLCLKQLYIEEVLEGVDVSVHQDIVQELSEGLKQVIRVIKEEQLFGTTLPIIRSLEAILAQHNSSRQSTAVSMLVDLVNLFYDASAEHYISSGAYMEGVYQYLLMTPPCTAKAIQIAVTNSNYALAMYVSNTYCQGGEDAPVALAQRIVSAYKDQQDSFQDMGTDFIHSEHAQEDSIFHREDTIYTIARLAVDFSDFESAVSVLCHGRKFLKAAEVANQAHRTDLLDEVLSSARDCTAEAIDHIVSCQQTYLKQTAQIAELWKAPAERLAAIALVDTTLSSALADEEEIKDTASEFSAISSYSALSAISGMSALSSASAVTGMSSGSTVSILSAISDSKRSITDSRSVSTAFSIQGLDHALLSRGTASTQEAPKYKRDQTERRKKRIERSKAKGYMKDVFGIKLEADACEELWKIVQNLTPLTALLCELSTILLSTCKPADRRLAGLVQDKMQELVKTMQSVAPPYAPLYPVQWLQSRQMIRVRSFQQPEAVLNGMVTKKGALSAEDMQEMQEMMTQSWFALCAKQIQRWFAHKIIALQSAEAV